MTRPGGERETEGKGGRNQLKGELDAGDGAVKRERVVVFGVVRGSDGLDQAVAAGQVEQRRDVVAQAEAPALVAAAPADARLQLDHGHNAVVFAAGEHHDAVEV